MYYGGYTEYPPPSPGEPPIINREDVAAAVRKLKYGKNDGDAGYSSNHLLFASAEYYEHVALLFTAMYIHGHQHEVLIRGTICSIPKDTNKSLQDGANYRGICLCSAISKILEIVFVKRNSRFMKTSDMQYAFKKGMGTTTCSHMLKEVVKYYRSRGSQVYCCYLDATKAFDRLRFDKLFEILLQSGIGFPDLRLLLDAYKRQQVRATWRGSASPYFNVECGIRQGGIASPTLFCMYLDRLLVRLKEAGDGCWIGPRYFGCLAYADDITLMSPTREGLQRMLRECEIYCNWSDLKFNASKSMAMVFGANGDTDSLAMLNDSPIQRVDRARHLGNIISDDLQEAGEIEKKKGDMIGRTNLLCASFRHLSLEARNRLFHLQCCHMYGCQAWDLRNRSIPAFITCYNRCARRVLHVSQRTHRRLLPVLTGFKPCLDRIVALSAKHIESMKCCPNENVNFFANAFVNDMNTIVGGNHHYISNYEPYNATMMEVVTGGAIVELLADPPAGFTKEEALTMANWLCVN